MATNKKKTIIVSSLYEFSDVASNELISNYKESHLDTETAPFFYYDASKQGFCAEIDQNDKRTMPDFLTRMAGYIQLQERAIPALDDEPRIRPMQETTIDSLLRANPADDQALLSYESDAESFDGDDVLDPMQHLTAEWKPRHGDISILPSPYAAELTALTGSSLHADETEKRYRIHQGDFQSCRNKLLRLEPLLETLSKDQTRATGNILIWPPNHHDSRIQCIKVEAPHPCHHRIIVNRQEQTLSSKVLGELRVLHPQSRELEVPDNLQYIEIDSTAECQGSKIWTSQTYSSFGDPLNRIPIVATTTSTNAVIVIGETIGSGDDRIAQWTTTINPLANPNIEPEEPVEVEATAPRRRAVIHDSDSDDDDPPISITRSAHPAPSQDIETEPLIQLSDDREPIIGEQHIGLYNEASPGSPSSNAEIWKAMPKDSTIQRSTMDSSRYRDGNDLPVSFGENHVRDAPPGPMDVGILNTPAQSSPRVLTRPAFNPTAYGSARPTPDHQIPRGQRGRGHQDQRAQPARGNYRGSRAPPVSNARSGRPLPNTNTARQSTTQTRQRPGLIDIGTTEQTSHAPMIAPGFEAVVPMISNNTLRPTTLLTETNPAEIVEDNDRQQETLPIKSRSHHYVRSNHTSGSSNSGRSRASRTSRITFRDEGKEYVTTSVPKPDHAGLRAQKLEEMEALKAQLKGENKVAEEEPHKLHSTMRQQGKNPGKSLNSQSLNSGKTPSKKEVAEAAARKQRVLEEAYGPVAPSNSPRPQPSTQPEEMSKWKRNQLKKPTPMAEAHPEIVGSSLLDQQTNRLVTLLQPVFEHARAFKGKVSFEIQIGQILVVPSQKLKEVTYHTKDEWDSEFEGKASHTFSSFTNILTANGADVDRALDIKSVDRGSNNKLWSSMPSTRSISYEFQCQSRSNENFQIAIDERGGYEIRKGQTTIGTVNLHVPAQIWDLSANLSAPSKWSDVPEAVAQSAEVFVKSLYVMPDRKKLVFYFRPPDDQEIKIRNLIVKRVSHHPSNRSDGTNLLLKVTEAKSLQLRSHPEDKKLWVAYEATLKEKHDYKDQMADAGRVHYEMSILHSGINEVLAKNEYLELGELTDETTTGKSLLSRLFVRPFLDAAVQTVSKIDFVGMWNHGTQKRLQDEEHRRNEGILKELGPRARTLQVPTTTIARDSGRTETHTFTGSTTGGPTELQLPVHGVRLNTVADIRVDETGKRYYYGMGGAMVPMADQDGLVDSAATVMPDDSASQVGGHAMQFGFRTTERNGVFW